MKSSVICTTRNDFFLTQARGIHHRLLFPPTDMNLQCPGWESDGTRDDLVTGYHCRQILLRGSAEEYISVISNMTPPGGGSRWSKRYL